MTARPLHFNRDVQKREPACFTGTGIPLASLFEHLAQNRSLEKFLEVYPEVSRQQAQDILELARAEVPRCAL
jgi:uncharacterized protein (DUF433 family)